MLEANSEWLDEPRTNLLGVILAYMEEVPSDSFGDDED